MQTDLLTKEFEQSSNQLKSYILRITASVADTEDIMQDTYIKASEKLDTLYVCLCKILGVVLR